MQSYVSISRSLINFNLLRVAKICQKMHFLTIFALYKVKYGLGISFILSISVLEPLCKGMPQYYNHLLTTNCLK